MSEGVRAYYNEIDPFAAAWLRELIKHGHIADGVVDERSIEDVRPEELEGYTQCHFFAGVGVWSYALRQAGWPDDRPVWTGSCPCQPFSAAGKGKGFADERHLWPAFHWLISQRRPGVVFGEQVAGKPGESWFDVVSTDLEAEGYACGPVVFPACGVGAPHLRKRLYWVAHAEASERGRVSDGKELGALTQAGRSGGASSLADSVPRRRQNGKTVNGGHGQMVQQPREGCVASNDCRSGSLADPSGEGPQGRSVGRDGADELAARQTSVGCEGCGPTNGFWRDADWLYCRDEKWRAVEPGTFPLVHGAAARVGRLRGYGNAIVAQQAQAFIEAYVGRKGGHSE